MKTIDDFAPWPTPDTATATHLIRYNAVRALYAHGRMQAPDVDADRAAALALAVIDGYTIARTLTALAALNKNRADEIARQLLTMYENAPAPVWMAEVLLSGDGLDTAEIIAAGTAAEEQHTARRRASRARAYTDGAAGGQ